MTMMKKILSAILICALLLPCASSAFAADETGRYSDDTIVRIGLLYGDNTVESFETSAPYGFELGYILKNGTEFVSLGTTELTRFTVARNENLGLTSAGKYFVATSNLTMGKYHVEYGNEFKTLKQAYEFIAQLNALGVDYAFPCFINDKIKVRSHDRTSAERAQASLEQIKGIVGSKYKLSVTKPSSNALVLIDPTNNDIVYLVDCPDKNLAVKAAQKKGEAPGYIMTPAKNTYPGCFEYRRVSAGIELINVMTLGEYVKGVLPWEINPNWHGEALKAFSTVVRTYTLYQRNKHSSSHFMLCNTVHCQVYNGYNRSTDASNAAVDATRDQVITYDGKLIDAVYSSSVGGQTANHNEVWGGTFRFPYLAAVTTPWENYEDYNNGKWANEVTPSDLASYLKNVSSYRGSFSGFGSSVSKIVPTYSESSGYVISVTVYDNNGKSVTIKNADPIRSTFGRYANSANMIIYLRFKQRVNSSEGRQNIDTGRIYTISGTNRIEQYKGTGENIQIMTANGIETLKSSRFTYVFDGKGWGHGVGLSQYGMLDLANTGETWKNIIRAYYTGVKIHPADELELK